MSEIRQLQDDTPAPDRMSKIRQLQDKTLAPDSMNENGPPRLELRAQVERLQGRQSPQAVSTTQVNSGTSTGSPTPHHRQPTSQGRGIAHLSTDTSSGVGHSSSSLSPPNRSDTRPTSTYPTDTNSVNYSSDADKAVAPSPPPSSPNPSSSGYRGNKTPSNPANLSITTQPQAQATTPPTGDLLSKFIGEKTPYKVRGLDKYQTWTYKDGLTGFADSLRDEVRALCSDADLHSDLGYINFVLATRKTKTIACLSLDCRRKSKKHCEKIVREIPLKEFAERYNVEGWEPQWEEPSPLRGLIPGSSRNHLDHYNRVRIIFQSVKKLRLTACGPLLQGECDHYSGAPSSIFGSPLDHDRAKATATATINLYESGLAWSTEHQLHYMDDSSGEESIYEDSSDDDWGGELCSEDRIDNDYQRGTCSEGCSDRSLIEERAFEGNSNDGVSAIGSNKAQRIKEQSRDPLTVRDEVIPATTNSSRSSMISNIESEHNETAIMADQRRRASSATTSLSELSDIYLRSDVIFNMPRRYTHHTCPTTGLGDYSDTGKVVQPTQTEFDGTNIKQIHPAKGQTHAAKDQHGDTVVKLVHPENQQAHRAECLEPRECGTVSKGTASRGTQVITTGEASSKAYTHDYQTSNSMLFITDTSKEHNPRDLMTQGQESHGCILPACSNFSPDAERKSFMPLPHSEFQPSTDSTLAANSSSLPMHMLQASNDCEAGPVGSKDSEVPNFIPPREICLAGAVDQTLTKLPPLWHNSSLDWAAYQMNTRQNLVNRVTLQCTESTFHHVFITSIATKDPIEGGHFWVKTRHGLLPARGLDNRWGNSKWRIQLLDGNFQHGDSGSPVFDLPSGSLYGSVSEAVLAQGIGYIVPAPDVAEDALRKCKLSYNEDFQWYPEDADVPPPTLPSKNESVDLLPNDHKLLPQPFDILDATVRGGDIRLSKKLFIAIVKNRQNLEDDTEWPKKLQRLVREAMRSDEQNFASYILENSKLDINARDDTFKQAPLHYAANFGSYEVCKVLFALGANISVRDAGDSTPLLIAIKNLHSEVAELLITKDHDGSTLTRADGKGETPLGMASFHGLDSVLKHLLQNENFRLDSQQYRHALRKVVVGGGSHGQVRLNDTVNNHDFSSINGFADDSENKLNCFLALWSSPQVKDFDQPDELYDSLQEAAASGENRCFHAILERVGKQDSKGYRQALSNCLVHACKSRSLPIVESLLEHNIDPLHEAQGLSALQAAIESGVYSLIRPLLDQMAKMGKNIDRQTAMNWAAKKGHADVVMLLGQHASCIISPGVIYRGHPLHGAAAHGHVGVLHELIKMCNGGSVDCKDFLGRTPLMIAAEKGHIEAMQLLHQAGAITSQTDGAGRTAVELAAVRGRTPVVDWFLENWSGEVSDMVICAAARSPNCTPDTMEALLRHGRPKNPQAVLRSSLEGHPDMINFLLNQESIGCHGIQSAVAEQMMPKLDYDAFVRLHEQCGTITNNQTVLISAIKNTQDAGNIVRWLLPRYENVIWDDDSLICAAAANDAFGFHLVDLILKKFPKTEVTIKSLETAAGNARWSSEIFEALFEHHTMGPISVTNRLLRELEGNCKQQNDALELLVATPKVNFGLLQVLEAVRIFGFDFIELLLDRHLDNGNVTLFSEMFVGHPTQLEALFEAAIDNRLDGKDFECDGEISLRLVSFLLESKSKGQTDFRCTTNMIELLADKSSNRRSYSSRIIKRLLTSERVILSPTDKSSQAILVAIVKAFDSETLRLATKKSGCRLELSASVLTAAASNTKSAKESVSDLLEISRNELADRNVSRTIITEAVMCAAARNEDGGQLIGLLAPYVSSEILTPSFWDAVGSNTAQTMCIMKLLLEKFPGPRVENGVLHIIHNFWAIGEEVLSSLPKPTLEHMVSKKLALITARHMKASALSDILDLSLSIAPLDELLEVACGNWKYGLDVATLLLERWPTDLTGYQVPKMVMLAAVENWISADQILKAFQSHKMKLTVTEKVLIAAVQNPVSCFEVAELLLHEADTTMLMTPQILTQAVANISRPVKLLKFLLPEACEHLLTESVLEAAAGNGAASRELLMYLCSRAGPQAITPNVILAAAKNSQPGRMGLVVPMHTISRGQNTKATPIFKNRNRLLRRSHFGPSCNFDFTAGAPYNSKNPGALELVWGSARKTLKQYSLKLLLCREWAWREGSSFLQYFLAQAPNVDVGTIINEAAEFTTCAMMRLLLEHTDCVTSETLIRAAKNELNGAELTEMLLLRHPNLDISYMTWIAALQNLNQGSDIMVSLLRHSKLPHSEPLISKIAAGVLFTDERRIERMTAGSDKISREIIESSAVNEQNGFDMWSALIKTSPMDIDDNFVERALGNISDAPRFLDSIVCCSQYTKVSSNVLVAAAGNQAFAPRLLARLLQLPRVDLSTTMPEILASAAGNEGTGLEALSCLIDNFGEGCGVHISFLVLQRAVRNRTHGSKIVRKFLTLLHKRPGEPIEQVDRLISAAVENECQGDTILEMLMEEGSVDNQRQCEDSVFTAAAGNTGCGNSLMALLIDFFETATFPLSTWMEACKNKVEGPGIVNLMLQRTADRSFVGKELFLAAATNESGGLEILTSLLSKASTMAFTEFLATVNEICTESSITEEIIGMVAQIRGEISFIHLHIDTVAQLEADTVQRLSRKAKEFMISDVGSKKVFFRKSKENSIPVRIPVQKAILEDGDIYLTQSVLEHFARYCDAEVFALLAKRHDIAKMFPAASQNQVYGGQIFMSYIGNKVLLENPYPLSFAIKHKNWTLLKTLVNEASQMSLREVIIDAAVDIELLQFLLEKVEDLEVTEELLIAACPDVTCLQLLLQRIPNREPEITENLLLAAINRATKPDSFLFLMGFLREPIITEALIVRAIEKVETLGLEALGKLIESMTPAHLSRAVVTKAAFRETVLDLLKRKFDRIPLYDQAIESAAPVRERIQLLWDSKQEMLMSSVIAPAVVAHEDSWVWLEEEMAAKGEPPIEVTEGMLKASMQNPNQLRNLLKKYKPRVYSQTLLSEASLKGTDALNAIQEHFGDLRFSRQTMELLLEKALAEVLPVIIGKSPPSRLVHALLESPVWFPSKEDDAKLEILLSYVQSVLPSRVLPLTLLFAPTVFRNIVDANQDGFTTEVLMKSLTDFSTPPNIEVALFKKLSSLSAKRFSLNFIIVIERYKGLVTEDLIFHALLCELTPLEIIHTLVRHYIQHHTAPLERWIFLVEVAGQAQDNGRATLRLLLQMLDNKGTKQTRKPVRRRIERLLIGDRKMRFSQARKLYATAKAAGDAETDLGETHLGKKEEGKDISIPILHEQADDEADDETEDEEDSGYGSNDRKGARKILSRFLRRNM